MSTVTLSKRPSGASRPRRSAVMALALLLALFLALPALPAKGGSLTWRTEPVDSPRGFGSLTHGALAVDNYGGFHFAYGERHLYYAYRQGGENAWRFETADDAPNVGSGAAIALDDAGLPHVSYCGAAGSGIRYAFRDAAGWHVETVYAPPTPQLAAAGGHLGQAMAEPVIDGPVEPAGGGGTPCVTSLAVGHDGRVHIAFPPNAPTHGLKYAFRDAVGWHVSTLDPGDFAGGEPSLALDSQGYPRVSYYGGYPYYDLRYAYRDAIGWHVLSLSHGGDAGRFSSMAIDDHDRTHIAYYEAYTGDLMYIRLEGDQWETEPVDTEGDVGQYASLALDSNGEPYISYYAAEPAAVKLAYRGALGWHAETVWSLGSMDKIFGDTAVALDPLGVPQVAFFDAGVQVLWLWRWDPASGWRGQVVDRGGTAGDNSSLKLDAQGYPHISYYAGYLRGGPFFGQLKHAWQDAAGWHSETLEAADDPGRGSSLQIDGTGSLHISYLAGKPAGRVLYLREGPGVSSHETVDEEAYNSGPTSLDLDATGNPRVSYVAANALKYAYRDPFGWQVEIVDQGTSGGCETPQASLALEANGQPHVAYSLCSPGGLRHAWQDGTGWHVEVVDSYAETGRYNSLALTVDGSPRIAYYAGYPYHELRYAWRDEAGWHWEMAFGGGDVGLYPSLVLDDAGQPHISFLGYLPDGSTMSLGVAERVNLGWSIGVGLYIGIDTRPGTSLALDAAGLPLVSFSGDGGLRFGRFVPWQMHYFPLVFR